MPKYVRGVFIMWKKILISIGLIIILIASIEIFNISKRNTNEEKNNIVENETEVSASKYGKIIAKLYKMKLKKQVVV